MNELTVLWVLMTAPSIMDNDVENYATQVTPTKSSYEVCLFVKLMAEMDLRNHYWCEEAS